MISTQIFRGPAWEIRPRVCVGLLFSLGDLFLIVGGGSWNTLLIFQHVSVRAAEGNGAAARSVCLTYCCLLFRAEWRLPCVELHSENSCASLKATIYIDFYGIIFQITLMADKVFRKKMGTNFLMKIGAVYVATRSHMVLCYCDLQFLEWPLEVPTASQSP